MINGKLKNGFGYELEDDFFDDWEILEILQKIDEGEQKLVVKVFPMLVGESQFAQLKEYIRNEKGKVSIASMVECFSEIMENHAKK